MRHSRIIHLSALALAVSALTTPQFAKAQGTQNFAVGTDAGDEDAKRWSVLGTLVQSLGAGTFVKSSGARNPSYGYLARVRGSYRIDDTFSAFVQWGGYQQITKSFQDEKDADGGTVPREFFVEDFRIGGSAGNLYTEENTGIVFSAGAFLDLPVSRLSRAYERIFDLNFSGVASKTWTDVGPGSITLSFSEVFTKFAGGIPTIGPGESPTVYSTCNTLSQSQAGECLTSLRQANFQFIHSLSASYNFLEDFSFGMSLTMFNRFFFGRNNSDIPRRDVVVTSSQFANPGVTDYATFYFSTISLGYAVTSAFRLEGGTQTLIGPFVGGNPTKLRWFPFWDFQTPSSNLSSLYLSASYSY